MREGMGVLGWSPKQFWKATHVELLNALDGWCEAHGVDPEEEDTSPGPGKKPIFSAEEVAYLRELEEEFPGG